METKQIYKPGDCIDYSPELWGEALTYEQLRQMKGRLVLVDDEWYTDFSDKSARGVEIMLVLNAGTDSDGDEYIRLEDHDGKAFPTCIYPNDMDPPDDADTSYTKVWLLNESEKEMIEITTKLPPAPAEPATPEYLEAFNLNARIHWCKDTAERGLAEMCAGIEQMRSGKQYKQLGYTNFEEYCQAEFGFTRKQGSKYADVGKMVQEQNGKSTSHFEKIGMEKLHLLAKLDEPTREAVTETVDVESVTVKELKAQIEKLEGDKASKDRQFKAAMESKQNEIDELRTGGKRRTDTLIAKIQRLQAELDAAAETPQAVAVEDTSRIDALEKELEQARAELAAAHARLAEKPMVQNALPEQDGLALYRAHHTALEDALLRMTNFLRDRPQYKDRAASLLLQYLEGMEEI